MKTHIERSIYIISGPCGVGKSTITQAMAREMKTGALIQGDHIQAMFTGKEKPKWEDQLTITWTNIVSLTKNFIEYNLDVVIDYVVEDELEWFCEQLSNHHVNIYYIVLIANKETLARRLNKRGDNYLLDRSIVLLDQLENNASNQPYLYDTTNKQPLEIMNELSSHINKFRL